jgi:hypothetical protein
MSRPEDPLGGKSHPTSQMSDQVRPEETRRATNAQAMPSAQARIENAIKDVRSNPDRPPTARLPKLPSDHPRRHWVILSLELNLDRLPASIQK